MPPAATSVPPPLTDSAVEAGLEIEICPDVDLIVPLFCKLAVLALIVWLAVKVDELSTEMLFPERLAAPVML